MSFTPDSEVRVKELEHSDWELLRILEYKGNRDRFEVPEGLETDFASVPRVFVWFLPRYGRYTKAAILHDYLWRDAVPAGELTLAAADGIFRRHVGAGRAVPSALDDVGSSQDRGPGQARRPQALVA
jgi:hypothetical protein